MPELPEVETVCRQLAPVLNGKTITEVEVIDSRWCQPLSTIQFTNKLQNKVILELTRRGKYLIFCLQQELYLIMHLRMTGVLLYNGEGQKHLRARIELSDGNHFDFVDPRRFGTANLVEGAKALSSYFGGRLGPEPFDKQFTSKYLKEISKGRSCSIKALLLDQKLIAGIGNIYADEALFAAGLNPAKKAGKLTLADCERLRETVITALNAGIAAKGATIDDFRHADGAYGSFQNNFLVHRREGLPCPNCELPVFKTRVAGRGTYLCKNCQK